MCYQLSDYRCESILLLKILLFYIAYFTLSSADWTSHPNLFGVEFRMRFHITCRLKSSVSDWSSGLTGLQNEQIYHHSVSSPPSQASACSCELESSFHDFIFFFFAHSLEQFINFFFQFKHF